MNNKVCTLVFSSLLLIAAVEVHGAPDSLGKHNLSASGSNEIRASSAVDQCTICHGLHNAFPRSARWDRLHKGVTYVPYSSSTMNARPGQPTGASLMCLSCHDGITAKGELLSGLRDPTLLASMSVMGARGSNLGTDLSDDHPISFPYMDSYAGNPDEYANPIHLSSVLPLDSQGQLQCVSCHDPHDDTRGKFLRVSNEDGELCTECHIKRGWSGSVHSTVTEQERGRKFDYSPGPCESCHAVHSAGKGAGLLRYAEEEQNCLSCHDGRGAEDDILAELRKPYGHFPGRTTGVHDAAEPIATGIPHVECADCHNPHAIVEDVRPKRLVESHESPEEIRLSPSLINVAGVDSLARPITRNPGVTHEYQVCFRCHGEFSHTQSRLNRQFDKTDTMDEFAYGSVSYHPVLVSSDLFDQPSLIEPLTETSLIKCSDCHGNDDLQGPVGPHASTFEGLLERRYSTQDGVMESKSAYALCYKCHNRDSILANESFSGHSAHISGSYAGSFDTGTSCSTCHDAHASEQPRLINFDINVVDPSASGRLEYFSTDSSSGGCFLSCHGKDHDPICYDDSGTNDC